MADTEYIGRRNRIAAEKGGAEAIIVAHEKLGHR